MNRKSKWLFLTVFILMIFIGLRIFAYGSYFIKVENDAKTINDLGSIRGSIQRLCKLELSKKREEKLEKKIDVLIDKYRSSDKEVFITLEDNWKELKILLEEYRKNPSEHIERDILNKSEECWKAADEVVLQEQHESERQLIYFKFLILSFGFDLLIICIILIIFKRYVYDNLEHSVIYDPLTKAFNRRYFDEYINHEISRANKQDKPFSLIILDIDYFKKVNDSFGHAAGDYVLEAMVSIIGSTIKKRDVLARIGGEEFAILLPDTKIEEAYETAEKVRIAVENYSFREVGKITISLGITEFKKLDNCDCMLRRADKALYNAKSDGRNMSKIE